MAPEAGGSLALKRRALALAQPLNAYLELTYACNWRCVFCYNPRHFDERGLATSDWVRVLDDLRALGTLTVTLTGGEPLRHEGALAIARAARERAFALKLFTNGSLVTEEVADALAEIHASVELSLHGARPETHDRTTGAPGSFQAMWTGIARLQARRVRVQLKAPLTRLNETELDAMLALAEAHGLTLRVDPTITPKDDGDPGPLQYAASAAGVERLYRKLASMGPLPASPRRPGGSNCGLGRLTIAIDPEGHVFPCLQWRRHPLGNVRDAPLSEIWRSAERSAAATLAERVNDAILAAGGPLADFPFCPALAAQRTGDPLRPDATHLAQAALAHRIRSESS
jgi:MoaA/NifB/PqqE/SkfB family radical SAM enzyme